MPSNSEVNEFLKKLCAPGSGELTLMGGANFGDNSLQELLDRHGIPYIDERFVATDAQLKEMRRMQKQSPNRLPARVKLTLVK